MSKVLQFLQSNTWLDTCFEQQQESPSSLNRAFVKKLDAKQEKAYRGFPISKTAEGEFITSLDPDSRFESLREVKSLIDWYLKGRAA